jgi:hypothetical protein
LEPGCESTGIRTYTASYDGHSDTKEEELPALGHDWGEPQIIWNQLQEGEEYPSGAVGQRICQRDNSHEETVECQISVLEQDCLHIVLEALAIFADDTHYSEEKAYQLTPVLEARIDSMSTEGITLVWNDLGADAYEVHRKNYGGQQVLDTTYTDPVGRTMGETYTYVVKAMFNGEYIAISDELTVMYNPFIDVPNYSFSFTHVAWAYNHRIVNGLSNADNLFGLTNRCSRVQFCYMLWNMNGKPSTIGMSCPFTDIDGVSANNKKAIIWCYNQKIVNGTSATTFAPKGDITRAQLAIMIWKMAGQPSVEGMSCPYTDLGSLSANNQKAVIWCYNNHLIDSITGTKFSPKTKGTRALLVEMLYGYSERQTDAYWERKEISLNSSTPGIKILGARYLKSNETIYMDYSCSGVEFNADCRNQLEFNVTVASGCMFKIYIDGQLCHNGDSDYFTVEEGSAKLSVSVEEERHNIRLVKVSHYRMALAQLDSLCIYGTILWPAPEEKKTCIEYIGDSIACGWGVVGLHNSEYVSCDGTLAYPYLVSQALNADYSIFGMSGQGAYYGDPSIQDCYLKTSYERSDEDYDFARHADAVVVNIGTNDYTYQVGEENFLSALANIIDMVRQKHGSEVKILIVYNMKNDGYGTVLTSFANEQGIALLKCDRSTNTEARNHPSIAEHAKYSEQITEVVEGLLGS